MAEGRTETETRMANSQRLIQLCKKPWQDNDESKEQSRELDRLLLEDIEVNAIDGDGRSALHYAAQLARVFLMDQLLVLGADVHQQEHKRGFSPLHFTLLCGTTKTSVDLLLSAGADVNAEAHFGVTPLHLASVIGPLDILDCLIERSADVSRREAIYKFTPLLIATYHSSSHIVDRLITKGGADVNASTDEGLTALHLAAMLGDVRIAKTLIKWGAKVNSRHSITGLTPLHLASTNGNADALNDLVQMTSSSEMINCSSVITETINFCSISMDGRAAVVQLLLRHGADLQARDRHGKTALHLATRHRSIVLEGLLKAGADVDVKDNDGRVALHEAIRTKHGDGLTLLLSYGADVNDVFEYCQIRMKSQELYDYAVIQLLEHFTKMIAAKLLIANVFKRHISEHGFQIFYGECVKEVDRMKYYKLANGMTMYALLHADPMRRLSFIKNVPVNLHAKFPMYCGIVRGCFLEAARRKPLVDAAKLAWERLTDFSWPDKCVTCLFGYMDNGALKMIVQAADGITIVKKVEYEMIQWRIIG